MTPQELRYRTLLKLGVVAAGDVVSPDDGETVSLRYQALHALLSTKSLVDWNISDDIPDEYELPIIDMVAAASARDFSVVDPVLQIEGRFGLNPMSIAERTVRQLASPTYVSKSSRAEYF